MLIGSSATLEGIENILDQFFYSKGIKVDSETLKIKNAKGITLSSVKVVRKGKRFRLESN